MKANSILKIAVVEPFYADSHKQWLDGLVVNSRHEFKLYTLPGRHWKWRMHGGAISLANTFLQDDFYPDVLLATDMLDLGQFVGMCRSKLEGVGIGIYFHENQLTYPWSKEDKKKRPQQDRSYGFINYRSALIADRIFFNSSFHKNSFLEALDPFLKVYPDFQNRAGVKKIREKSAVLPIGLDLKRFDLAVSETFEQPKRPIILWNHRWEYDKNPEDFFSYLAQLADEGFDFDLALVGKSYKRYPSVFDDLRDKFKDKVLNFGYLGSFDDYKSLLHQATILPVTSIHDFFGISVVESLYCNCIPLLPNQLSYPEHLPKSLHSKFLYNDPMDFMEKLRFFLNAFSTVETLELSSFVSKYDWSNLVELYDNALQNLQKNPILES